MQDRRVRQRLHGCHADEGRDIQFSNAQLISMCLEIASNRRVSVVDRFDVLFKGSDEMADTDKQSIFDQLAKPHANRLLQAFARIDHDGLRQSVVQLVEEIANNH